MLFFSVKNLMVLLSEVAVRLGVHSDLIYRWQREMKENGD